jgi:uracil-DNA glycosylase family 4
MAPGREELQADRPLVGGSGRLFWALAKKAGIKREACYIVNTIGEWPEGADGNPTQAQYEAYWTRFDEAVGAFKGRVALLLGGAAIWRFAGLVGGVNAWRGYVVSPNEALPLAHTIEVQTVYKTSRVGKYKKGDPRTVRCKQSSAPVIPQSVEVILPTLHPAGVMRSGFTNLPALQADLLRAERALKGTLMPYRQHYGTAAIVFANPDAVAFDIETEWPDHKVIGRIGFAGPDATWTAPWQYGHLAARAILERPGAVKVAHNISFDLNKLEDGYGLRIADPIWDTMLAAQMLQPDLYKGLNAVASLYLDRPRWKHLGDSDPPKYNAFDASATLELYRTLRGELRETGQLELFEGTIMPAVRVLIGMTRRGIRVDEKLRPVWLEELKAKEDAALSAWSRETGAVNPASPAQLAKYLYGTLGLPPQYGKYGTVTTDVGALKDLQRAHPERRALIQSLLDFRAAAKMRSTYAENPLGDDGCVHPGYLPGSKDTDDGFGKGMAGTGRITGRDPNPQNIPQEARRIYVPHRSDMVLLEADYSQIELRVAASLSGDEGMLEALKGDLHSRTMELLNCDRTRAKNVMYGTLYGAGPRKLVQVLRQKGFDITEAEAKELQNALARAYPRLWEWRQKVVNDVAANYYLTNPFGRRRYFLRGAEDAPAAIDFLPQSTAADVLWRVLTPLEAALGEIGGALLTVVHDSVLAEVPATLVAAGAGALKRVMEQEFPEVAPGFMVPVNIKTGSNWGSMEDYDG